MFYKHILFLSELEPLILIFKCPFEKQVIVPPPQAGRWRLQLCLEHISYTQREILMKLHRNVHHLEVIGAKLLHETS
jgi:hypothetical protein